MNNKKISLNREKRYKEKIELAEERLSDVEELISDFDNKIKRLACYKAFQEVVEALFDIIAMFLKDKNKIVKDDYANIGKLEEIEILEKNDAAVLREANGLRNRVIHKYNKTDDNTAKESILILTPNLKNILNKFKRLQNEK